MQLIAVYMPEEFDAKSTNFIAEQQSMLHMNVHLIHGDEPRGVLMRAGDKYAKGIVMIHEELWQKEDKNIVEMHRSMEEHQRSSWWYTKQLHSNNLSR